MATKNRKLRILVVDDEPMVLKSIQLLLRADGHEAAIADGADVALQALGQTPFDLVITDLAMPGTNGGELATAVKERFPGLPVIMITASEDNMGGAKQPLGGVDRLMNKPFSRAELQEAIARIFR